MKNAHETRSTAVPFLSLERFSFSSKNPDTYKMGQKGYLIALSIPQYTASPHYCALYLFSLFLLLLNEFTILLLLDRTLEIHIFFLL